MNIAAQQLAPQGLLRAGLNLSNYLLVSGQDPQGQWQGVAPDMARAIAGRLGVGVEFVPYKTPGELADAADTGAWSIGLIGADPARAEKISFTAPYAQIEATYLVPPGSALQHADDVDRDGVRIAGYARSAYDLWLVRNIKHATLVHVPCFDAAWDLFCSQGLEALACLKPKLLTDQEKFPGSRILPGYFMTVQQAVGTSKKNPEAAAFLAAFVEEMKAGGKVAAWIDKHKSAGLSVAPAA